MKTNPAKINPARSINWLIAILALAPLAGPNLAFAAQAYTVPAEFWEQPRSSKAVLEQPALRQGISAWLAKPGNTLVIHYGSGEEALLRAEELRAWLIALAVEEARIEVAGDLAGGDELRIELLTKNQRGQ